MTIPTTITTINLARNPSIEVDTSDWFAGGSPAPTLTQSSAQAKFGTKSLLATWGTNGTLPLVEAQVPNLTTGVVYTASVYVFVPSGDPDVFVVLGGLPDFFDAIGTGTSLKDQWVRLEKTHICDVNTTETWHLQIWPSTAPTSGDQVYLDGLQVEAGETATDYVDGTQPKSEWDGPSHVSSSRRLPGLAYADVALEYDDDTIANTIRITRVGGAEQVAQDATSQELNLVRTHQRADLIIQTDAEALDYARFILRQAKDPELRFTQLLVRPQADPNRLFPQVLAREIGDRIRIELHPPGGGDPIIREVFIRGIEHVCDGEAWSTVWTLQSATKWLFLILDHATLGRLDLRALGF